MQLISTVSSKLNRDDIYKFIRLIIPAIIFSFSTNIYAADSAMLELIEILHNKGSITDSEYSLLRNAAVSDQEQGETAKQEIQEQVDEKIQVATKSINTADWASKISLKGDMRLRYSGIDTDPGNSRNRGRLRYRLGVTAKPTAGWEVAAGLASGGNDLRSTNQTFDSTFSTKGINLDYAYTQYKFNDNIMAAGGKIKYPNYLYTASDLMWDSDINPEGFSVNFTHNSELGSTFANSGIWVIEEDSRSNTDPHLVYAQLGQRFGNDSLFGNIAGTFYTFSDTPVVGSFLTESINSDSNFGDIYSLAGELGLKDPFGNGIRTSVFGEWVKNADTITSEDHGYLVGVKASQGPWSLTYNYADLEQNAWPDIFPDSDRFDGFTGIKVHELIFTYELMKNVGIAVDYYFGENTVLNEDQTLLQIDLSVKF